MKCREIMDVLEALAPKRFACEWDNPGLLAGRQDKEVKKILITVDCDDCAVETAVREHADMIVSHHPLIFKAVKHVTDEDFIGRRLVAMIQSDISYFAMHTNFDSAPGCMADVVADRLGIVFGAPLEEMGEENGVPYGIGKIGVLKAPMNGRAVAKQIKEEFGLPYVTVYGSGLWEEEPVKVAATCPGSGGSTIKEAVNKGAQVLVTGDISHHEGIDAEAQGLMIIDAGHYGLEHVFMDYMEGYLKEQLGEAVEIIRMPVLFPAVVV